MRESDRFFQVGQKEIGGNMSGSSRELVASIADGIPLVLGVNEVDRQAAQKAKESLTKVKAHILGVVLNKVKPGRSGYGKYYYHYSDDEEEI